MSPAFADNDGHDSGGGEEDVGVWLEDVGVWLLGDWDGGGKDDDDETPDDGEVASSTLPKLSSMW